MTISKNGFALLAAGVLLLGLGSRYSFFAMPTAEHSAAALPATGKYQIDPIHTFVYFGAWHHVVGLVRGRFEMTTGTITVSPDPADCRLDVAIETATISTQNTKRDDDLRGPDFFDAKEYPALTYRGRGLRRLANNMWDMEGLLTIRGVSRPVPLIFTFKGLFPDTKSGEPKRAAFHATAETKRGDFGMTRDNLMELGVPPALGSDVSIEIDVEADAAVAGQ